MANGFPVWRMGQMQRTDPVRGFGQRPQPVSPPAPPLPTPEPEPQREEKKEGHRADGIPILPEGFRPDRETMLLLALGWLLWQEKADKRLILALIYILL